MKAKSLEARRNRALTPLNRFSMNFDAVVTPSEIVGESEREISDARADIENSMIRLESLRYEFRARTLTGLLESDTL